MKAQRVQAVVSMMVLALALVLAALGAGCGGGRTSAPGEGSGGQAVAMGEVAATAVDPAQRAADDERARADLAADVGRRVEKVKQDYGADVPLRVESGLFVVVRGERGAAFDAAADLAQRGLDVFLGSFFARRPDRAVTVYVVRSMAEFARLCDARFTSGCERDLGAYSRKTREIIVDVGPGASSVLHELVHPLVQTDFPRAPVWFEEGIAALFEKPVFAPAGELHGGRNWRDDRLAGAMASPAQRGKVHLPGLFALNDGDVMEGPEQDLEYAMARAFCEWADGQGLLWPFYRAWRDGVAEDPRGERSFQRVTGMTVEEADGAWRKWVMGGR